MKRKYVEEVCGICLSAHSSVVALSPCMHEFCLACVSSWLVCRLNCPLCKQKSLHLLHDLTEDRFEKKFKLKSIDFKAAWAKRAIIELHFTSRRATVKAMNKMLYNALKATALTVDLTRRWIYLCGLKTIVHKKHKTDQDISKIPVDPGHKIWQWLQVELAIFFSSSEIRSFLKFAKLKASSYADLSEVISGILSDKILPKFIYEMESFFLYNDSCENYYSQRDIKITVARIPGQSLDTIIIKDGEICLKLLSKLIIRGTFCLEHEYRDSDCDLSTFQEISHINYLATLTSKDDPSIFLFYLQNFINIRLQRIGRLSRDSLPTYTDNHKFCSNYLPLYTDCFNYHRNANNNPPELRKPLPQEYVDLTEEDSYVIDLT